MIPHNIRFPDELHARVARAADSDRRSFNAEVLWLLEQALAAKATPLPQ